MQSKKLPKRLFKNRDVVHTYEHDRATRGGPSNTLRETISTCSRTSNSLSFVGPEGPAIDDAVIDRALHDCSLAPSSRRTRIQVSSVCATGCRDAVAPQGCVGPGLDRLPEENPEISPPAFQPVPARETDYLSSLDPT